MGDGRDTDWILTKSGDNWSYDQAKMFLLMDIRNELRKINRTLQCYQFQQIPNTLREISRNTKPKKKPTIK